MKEGEVETTNVNQFFEGGSNIGKMKSPDIEFALQCSGMRGCMNQVKHWFIIMAQGSSPY